MAKQTFTTGQVLTAAQVNSLQSNDFNQTVSVKTASYTLVAADKGTRIEFNTSGSVTCTVNSGLFDAGDTLIIQNRGAGTVTVTAGTATVNTSATLALAQYDAGTLYFVSDSAAIFFNTDAGGGSPLTTKGDIYVYGTSDTRLPVGTNNYVLTAASGEATGLKWAAPAGGKVLQVVSATTTTSTTITTTTLTDTTLTATITPTLNTSKVLVMAQQHIYFYRSATNGGTKGRLLRDATTILDYPSDTFGYNEGGTAIGHMQINTLVYLDSPATTSATTYKVQAAAFTTANGGAVICQYSSVPSTITLLEIGA